MAGHFDTIATQIESNLKHWQDKLRPLGKEAVSLKLNRQERSVRQICGHMIDSASNNTHRIIHLQYRESPVSFPDYANLGNNDRWIAIQNFQEEDWTLIMDLWNAIHRHLAHVIRQVDESKKGALWISALEEEISLDEMICDFPKHMDLHLKEIEELLKA